ncbi:MAG TPA: ATP-binding cassette domain-containing protein [Thermoflexus sp.]|nr:ATP-binding cassette domain-containing protein [Thermoflexus sp.]
MGLLKAEALCKSYISGRRRIPVLRNLHLEVRSGEVVCIIGPSGAGKSTLLRLLAGLDRPDEGWVTLNGRPVQSGTPELAVMFQNPLLLPWLNVRDNVKFGLRFLPGCNAAIAQERVAMALRQVGLLALADRPVTVLSGGEAQRVALARALVRQPRFLLLDEPFSNLDVPTRQELNQLIRRLALTEGVGVVLVTHDLEEALHLGDRLLLLSPQTGNFIREYHPRDCVHSLARHRLQEELTAALWALRAREPMSSSQNP